MPDFFDTVKLQHYVTPFFQELGPVLNHGRYYFQYVVRCYVENGGGLTPKELLRRTGLRYGKTPENIAGCIQRFVRGVCLKEGMEDYADRWRELGWDGETALTPSYFIPLVCRGFYPYVKRHHPKEYKELKKLFPPPKD